MREISQLELPLVSGGALDGATAAAGLLGIGFTALAVVATAPLTVVALTAAASITGAIAIGSALLGSYPSSQGSGGGGGGGGGACVAVASFLPNGRKAGDVVAGDVLDLADEKSLVMSEGEVTFSKKKMREGYRITTQSGISLVCSDSAPIPTREGLVLAPNLLGKQVPTRRDSLNSEPLIAWEFVELVEAVGQIEVQHISIHDKCFWAGSQPDCFILHHNKLDEDDWE